MVFFLINRHYRQVEYSQNTIDSFLDFHLVEIYIKNMENQTTFFHILNQISQIDRKKVHAIRFISVRRPTDMENFPYIDNVRQKIEA